VFNARVVWVPIESTAKVGDLLTKWAHRTGVSDYHKYCLMLSEGELFEEDTLKQLAIQQRETINVVLKPLPPKLEPSVSKPQPHPVSHQPMTREPSAPTHSHSVIQAPSHELPSQRPVTMMPSHSSAVHSPTTVLPPSAHGPGSTKFAQFFYHAEQKSIKPLVPTDNLSSKKAALREQGKTLLQNHDEFHHMKPAVLLPSGANENDWLHIYIVSFYNNCNVIYSKFANKCTVESCPHTSAGLQNYLWMDLVKKAPVDIPAPEYFTNLFEWILTDNFSDEAKFPLLTIDGPYEANYRFYVSDIARRLFRVYGHLYHHHYSEIADNSLMAIENFEKSFELFYHFVTEFKLVTEGDLKPMEGLINIINM